jgi:hypothetical protein
MPVGTNHKRHKGEPQKSTKRAFLVPFCGLPLCLLCTFLISLVEPLMAQEWVEYANHEDRFTCNFPTQPKVTETTYRSEFGADLPARTYSAMQGQSRYSMTVVDYNQVERILTDKSKKCPPGAETCIGGGITGAGYWKNDIRGAIVYASFQFLKRDAKLQYYGWNFIDLVEGGISCS